MRETTGKKQNDCSKGPVWKCIITQAVPLTIAQLVQLLYNVVDRIYLGHMEDGSSYAFMISFTTEKPVSIEYKDAIRTANEDAYYLLPRMEGNR